MSARDGGSAFPVGNPTVGGESRMSLRDLFAMAVIHAQTSKGWAWDHEELAKLAYQRADAMIAARGAP